MITFFIIFSLVLFAGVVFWKKELGIYLVILLLPTYQIRFQISGIPLTFLECLILILAATTLANLVWLWGKNPKLFPKKQIFNPSPENFFILFFLLAALVSVFVSPVATKAAGIFKAYFLEAVLFYFLVLLLIDSKEKLAGLWKSLAVLVIYLSVFGIYQFVSLEGLPFSWWAVNVASRRITSLVNHPNALALVLGPCLAMLAALLFASKTLERNKLLIAATSLGLIAFSLSFSRAGWCALAITLTFLGLLSGSRKKILSIVLAIILIILLIPISRHKIFELASSADPSQQNRLILWNAALTMLKKSPLYGAGLMGFHEAYKNYPLGPDRVIQNYPHNFFLNFWVETGLVGLVAMIGLLFFFFKKIFKLLSTPWRALALAAAAGMGMIILHGLVDVPYFKNDLAILFWIIYALPNLEFLRMSINH
jgi:O-antigen ligase